MWAGIEAAIMSETRAWAAITPVARFTALLRAAVEGIGRPLHVSSEDVR